MATSHLPHISTILIFLFAFPSLISPAIATHTKRPLVCVTPLKVEGFWFHSTTKPPGSTNRLFLGGAGVRGIQMEKEFVKFTSIGVYLENKAIPLLAATYKGKTAGQLNTSVQFPIDIVQGSFEKLTVVKFITNLTGVEYSSKVIENAIAEWKAAGIYTEEEQEAANQFLDAFKTENFPRGSYILFSQYPQGKLTIAFRKTGSKEKEINAVINNKAMSQAVLLSIIGEGGVSPAARASLATRMSKLLNLEQSNQKTTCVKE